MSDHDIAVAMTDVSRMFKRYRYPRYRVLEALGLPLPKNAYDQFWALRGISLELRRGESLGIIGQNGAGKSTLLNIICGRLLPTSGTVTVRGTIQALMELGTGFHPEFSGRENVLSALAYQNVTGRKAREQLDEIIDFSELAEFINQPVKTYSSGMYARLAFSTATTIVPDVLIIDEVLSVGDAYFAAKCAHRMRGLMQESGATVLFVSHDMASVQRLCDRAIWIERGKIRQAGATLDVSKSYYADVVAREETRLRAQTSLAVARMRRRERAVEPLGESDGVLVRLVATSGQPPRASHAVRRLALIGRDRERVELSPGQPMDNDSGHPAHIETDPEYMCWSLPKLVDGSIVRCFEDTGGRNRHAPVFFHPSTDSLCPGAALEIEHAAAAGEEVAVEIYEAGVYRRIGILTPPAGHTAWRVEIFPLAADLPPAQPESPAVHEQPSATKSDDGGTALAPLPSGVRDKWATAEASFLAITVGSAANPAAARHIFALAETISFRIVAELRAAVALCWIAMIILDGHGNRVLLGVHKFENGLPIGKHEMLLRLERPNLRQGEYVVSFELLPHFDYNWDMAERLPYLCHWDRCVYFKIDEGYDGTIDLGRVALPLVVTARPLSETYRFAAPIGLEADHATVS
jgi:lipopolysaccharide transport system ATP-binding protein